MKRTIQIYTPIKYRMSEHDGIGEIAESITGMSYFTYAEAHQVIDSNNKTGENDIIETSIVIDE